ncbi:MAG: MlaC/ttg2D family ABC transporter substrate-binding protein [Candidatus Binatia bacterium]
MKEKSKSGCWAGLIAIAYIFFALPVNAGSPTDQIRVTVEKVLMILNNPQLKSDSKKKERRDQLREVIYARFDFNEMAKRSLGSHWQSRTPEEQREFVKVFTELLEESYVNKVEFYNGEKFLYVREMQNKNLSEVNTKLVTQKGEEFSINYKLHLANGEWKVYDVVLENISLVNNFRSQFSRVLTNSSYEELLRRMKEKQVEAPRRKEKDKPF